MFTVQAFGKTYRFKTEEQAREVANEYYSLTGIIVGIEYQG